MRILIIGKDARTDAIARACQGTDRTLFAMAEMPIPGLVEKCQEVFIRSLTDVSTLPEVVDAVQPDLAIIGPEEPLEAGFVDALLDRGVPTFGPTQALAAIESSKSWTRSLVSKYGIPGNPAFRYFDSFEGLPEYLHELEQFVVKPDGLTAGKGVKVFGEHLHSFSEAEAYARELIDAGARVQIEERLEGEEFSLQSITDGETVVHLPLVQDHKRAYDGDTGPNTGGMGSYSCADGSLPFLTADDVRAAQAINEAVVRALRTETGQPYRGVLYGGFMATRDGVKLIEYNARFGDPEAMNVFTVFEGDFVEVCTAVASGTLKDVRCEFRHEATVCKYVVPQNYPGKTEGRSLLNVPRDLRDGDGDVRWYWAASALDSGKTYATGSRAGAVVARGATLAEAEARAEEAASRVVGDVRYRTDIGRQDVIDRRVEHMQSLRGKVYA